MAIKEDHSRFKDIVRGRIKENFKKYVSQGEMIGKREDEYVKIPLPSVDIPNFRYGAKQQGGIGQGEGKQGEDVGEILRAMNYRDEDIIVGYETQLKKQLASGKISIPEYDRILKNVRGYFAEYPYLLLKRRLEIID